jgi:hypothetical protein
LPDSYIFFRKGDFMLPPYTIEATELKTGIYQHYSGKHYEVHGVGRHSESLDEYVIYRALYAPDDYWIRPLKMFIEEVNIGGQRIHRFTLIGEK